MGPKQGWTADISGLERRCSEPGSGSLSEAGNLGSSGDLRLGAVPATLVDSDSSRASRLCRPGHQLIRAQTTDSPLTPLAGVFFTADRAERRLAPAIDLLREEAEREA